MEDGSKPLNECILDFAKDLKRLTKDFADSIGDKKHRDLVECALAKALVASCDLAKQYEIQDPL